LLHVPSAPAVKSATDVSVKVAVDAGVVKLNAPFGGDVEELPAASADVTL
jgi:hypothetical protein